MCRLERSVAGFSTRVAPKQTVPQFCATNPNAFNYSGGLIGAFD